MSRRRIRPAEEVAEEICRETVRLYELCQINDTINRMWKSRVRHLQRRMQAPNFSVTFPGALSDITPLITPMTYNARCWRMAIQKLNETCGEDIPLLLLKRLKEISLGESTEGNVQGLIYLVGNMLNADHELVNVTDTLHHVNDCDTPQAINALAARLINLVMCGDMSIRTADRVLSLLKKKISFIETAEVMQDVEELKKLMAQYQSAPVVTATETKPLVDVTPGPSPS